MKHYIPEPIDTSDVELDESLLALSDIIAKNVHENWSKKRMDEGWTYGEVRDDNHKHHPCLVAYEELTEVEKAYDRQTAYETIKLLKTLGYEIHKK